MEPTTPLRVILDAARKLKGIAIIVPMVVAMSAIKIVTNMVSSTSFKVLEGTIFPFGKVTSNEI